MHSNVIDVPKYHVGFVIGAPQCLSLFLALLFRGLDAATTEEGILKCLNSTQMTCKNMQIIRDVYGTSLGYGFLELSSVAESMNVLEILKALDPPLEVDGKQILVSFAKNTFSTT